MNAPCDCGAVKARVAQHYDWCSSQKPLCERCAFSNIAMVEGVQLESSRTMYHWDGKGEDPNRPIYLCRPCAQEHHEYWDGMWRDYYGGLL